MEHSLKLELAIVIPAYKSQYLNATLLSISKQTDNDFTVYIGDDNSPDDIYGVVKCFDGMLKIIYKKFHDNLGSINLTLHWERCIAMTKNEKWIWLFSDDDLMDTNCISMFKQAVVSTQSMYDLFRFNTKIINHEGKVVQNNTVHPLVEDAYQFAISRLELKRSSYVVEYIFSKQKYLECGKFVNFPLAWSSDDATWINIGLDKGIFTISSPNVYWRYSFTNISSSQIFINEKIAASLQYLIWLKNWITTHYPSNKLLISRYEKAKLNWLKHQIKLLNKRFTIIESYKLSLTFNQKLSTPIAVSTLLFFDINFAPLMAKFRNMVVKSLKIFTK